MMANGRVFAVIPASPRLADHRDSQRPCYPKLRPRVGVWNGDLQRPTVSDLGGFPLRHFDWRISYSRSLGRSVVGIVYDMAKQPLSVWPCYIPAHRGYDSVLRSPRRTSRHGRNTRKPHGDSESKVRNPPRYNAISNAYEHRVCAHHDALQ
jgi:hypothetical protein